VRNAPAIALQKRLTGRLQAHFSRDFVQQGSLSRQRIRARLLVAFLTPRFWRYPRLHKVPTNQTTPFRE
jgi:hypothetical protein